MKHRFSILILVLSVLLTLGACRSVQEQGGPDLAGTGWILSSVDGDLPLPGATITLQFGADAAATGSDGCNNYKTTYTTEGNSLAFGQPMGATMMACPEPVMNQATTYMQVLASTDSFDMDSRSLTLRSGRKTLATFVASSQGLEGTSWQIVSYNNGRGGVVSVIIGSQITADFSATEISGDAGCNDYFASYVTDGSNFSVGPTGTTQRACQSPPGVMEQEWEYLAALTTASTFSQEGNRLILRTADGDTAVNLTRELEVSVPKPEPGKPTGRVTASGGVNVLSGPGSNYPVLGVAPFGTEGEVIGRSQDGQWWAVALPSAPGTIGWVSATNVAVVNAENVPVLQPDPPAYVPPPAATPAFTPTPVPAPSVTPAPQLSFWADQTTLDQGQCTNLGWSVENVQAVWVYPQGQKYEQYPREGQGSEQVCPQSSTTYEMRVLLRDGSVATQQVSITVNNQNPLADTAWEVTAYNNGRGGAVSVIIDTRISARFGADNQVAGSAGCNDYSGGYQIGGSSLSFGPLGSSMQACGEPEGIMQQESEFLAALQSASTFELDGNRLTIRDGSGATAVSLSR